MKVFGKLVFSILVKAALIFAVALPVQIFVDHAFSPAFLALAFGGPISFSQTVYLVSVVGIISAI